MLGRSEIIPLRFAGAFVEGWAALLEMHVPNSNPMPPQASDRIAAPETIMTRIETQSDELRLGQFQQAINFFGRLDISGCVRMHDATQTGLFAYRSGHIFDAFGKRRPLSIAQTIVRA